MAGSSVPGGPARLLRRRWDRAETAVLGALLAVFLAGAPFAAHAAGGWAYAVAAGRVQLSATLAVAALAVLVLIAGALTRRALDARRMAGWDADWLATGPRWSPRR